MTHRLLSLIRPVKSGDDPPFAGMRSCAIVYLRQGVLSRAQVSVNAPLITVEAHMCHGSCQSSP